MNDLPKSIRVGPYDISIVHLPSDSEDFGQFHLGDQELRLQKEFRSGVAAVDTFVHELAHAAWRVLGLPGRATEEQVCSSVAPIFTQVFRDHPEVLHWMLKKLSDTSATTKSSTTPVSDGCPTSRR